MSLNKNPPILLIHGTWFNGKIWGDFAEQLKSRGFEVYTPSLRHHGVFDSKEEYNKQAELVSKVGLLDYVADLEKLVAEMDAPPIIIGHSLGGLIAQLLAVRCKNQGLVLLCPAPAAGIFSLYPSMARLWSPYFMDCIKRRPILPVSFKKWQGMLCNTQTEEVQKETYSKLCADSGQAYFEMSFWQFDKKKAAQVDFKAIKSPVLVIGASKDSATGPKIAKATAKKYGDQARYVEINGSDHMVAMGQYMPETLRLIDEWAKPLFG